MYTMLDAYLAATASPAVPTNNRASSTHIHYKRRAIGPDLATHLHQELDNRTRWRESHL